MINSRKARFSADDNTLYLINVENNDCVQLIDISGKKLRILGDLFKVPPPFSKTTCSNSSNYGGTLHLFISFPKGVTDYVVFEDEAKIYVTYDNLSLRTLVLYDISNPIDHSPLGNWSLPTPTPERIIANSNRTVLFITHGYQGFSIFDISNRTTVTFVASTNLGMQILHVPS